MPETPLPKPLTAEESTAARTRARRGTLLTLGVMIGLIALVVLLTPVNDNMGTDTRLTTLKYGPGNARLAADLARQLGWQVKTSNAPLRGTLDSTVIYAIFSGPTPLPQSARTAVTAAVRRGAGLLLAPSADEGLALPASLGLHSSRAGLVAKTPLGKCPPESDRFAALRIRPRMVTYDTVTQPPKLGATPSVPFPNGALTLLSSEVEIPADEEEGEDGDSTRARADSASDSSSATRKEMRPSVVAFPLGRGRVVAMADPDLLRTDQLRSCAMGTALTFIRGLEYLSVGRQRTIVFSEYYQGSRADGPGVVLSEWLRGTGPGRTVLSLAGACIVLLLARGRRTLAPVYHAREERRSALEHVDALATAWQAVRGTRTVARMLARGIRRRHAATARSWLRWPSAILQSPTTPRD
jgi:hypothetical protein